MATNRTIIPQKVWEIPETGNRRNKISRLTLKVRIVPEKVFGARLLYDQVLAQRLLLVSTIFFQKAYRIGIEEVMLHFHFVDI